jgi:hypothetical protein
MPLVSAFFGILVYMFKEKNSPHNTPHVHAAFGEFKMSIASDGTVLAGRLPRKQQKYVEAWVALREDEINASWTALNENGEVIKFGRAGCPCLQARGGMAPSPPSLWIPEHLLIPYEPC